MTAPRLWHASIDYHLQAIAAATHASKARFAEPIRQSLVIIDETVRAYRERYAASDETELDREQLLIQAMAAGKSEGFRECARRLARVLDDEPNWHIVFGEVVKLRIGQLHRGGLRDTDIAEAVGWPLCDIETVLEGERCAPDPSGAEGPAIVRHFADLDEKSIWRALVKLGFAPDLAWKGVHEYRLGCAPGPSDEWVPVSEWQAAEPTDKDGAAHVGDIDLDRGGASPESLAPEPSECSCLDTGAYHEDPPPCPVHGVIREPRADVEALRSLLADLADGVRPIDREEVSRRIDEALRDPTPEQAEAESMLAAIRQVSIDRLGDVGGGCDLVTDIDSALARGRYFALESRRLRSALSRVGVELGSGNMDRAHEMAREALDAPGSDPDQTWIMTDEATTSGKALFKCSLCGAMNPAPARGHDCAAPLNLRTGPTLRDDPDSGAPTGPGWWRWKHHQHWVGVEVDGDLSFQLPHSGSRVLTAAFGGGWWGGRCQGIADAGAPTEPGWPNAPRTSADLGRLGLWWFTRPDRWTDGDVVWTPTRVLVDSHGQMWATFGPNRRTSVGCDSLAWGGPCRQGSADAGVLAIMGALNIDGAECDGLPSIADLCVEIERTLDRADGVDATREAARATRYAKATREVQTRLDALVASVDLHHDEMRDHVAGGCTMNVPTMESEMDVLRTALAAANAD